MQVITARSHLTILPSVQRCTFSRPLPSAPARHAIILRSSAPAPVPEEPAASSAPAESAAGLVGWWKQQQTKNAELKKKLLALGPAAVLAYGLFDGISYTIAFCLAFLAYEAQTGLNPTQNVLDIVKIMVTMWAGNNVTRPFRIGGAAALAPFMDKLMDKLTQKLRLPRKIYAFAIITATVALACFSVIGALFLSRWVSG